VIHQNAAFHEILICVEAAAGDPLSPPVSEEASMRV
jgi:hypothetical protein